MNERPRSPEGTDADTSGRRLRGQSDVIAIVLLLGMVFLGATAVVVTGGYLVDSVQENSETELAEDTAVQTHQQIAEAALSGEARQLPTSPGNAIQSEVIDSGSITLTMTNGSDPCGVDPVSADLGAIEYDSGERTMIYEGGAIWEYSDAGYSTRRAPGIDYSSGSAQLSLTVIGGTSTNDQGQPVATPRPERSERLNQNLADMILDCRLADSGNTDLNVSVESQHADAWQRYFEGSVAAGNGDVNVTRVSDTEVNLSIDELSERIDYDEWLVVHEWERGAADARIENGSQGLNASVRVRNTGPIATNGTVSLDVPGIDNATAEIDDLGRGELQWVDLRLNASQLSSLTPGTEYDYHVNVTPTSEDRWHFEGDNSSVSHSFYFGEPEDVFNVLNVGHTINSQTVNISGLIGNIGTEQGIQDVELSLYHVPSDTDIPLTSTPTIATNLSANATGAVSWQLNRSTIAGGTYRYTISTDDDSENGTFEVSTFDGGDGGVRTGIAGTGTITVLGTEVSAESLLNVEVPESERDEATLERADRGMFMPTLVADDHDWGADPVYQPDGGWVPAERVGGTLQPTGESPECGSEEPTDYETDTSETDDDWYGWQVDDCWSEPDGFVWSDSGGYDLEWAIAGETTTGGGWLFAPTVSRTDTTWTLGGDGELEYEKDWSPVSAHVAVEQDGDTDRYYEWEPGDADEDENLNTYDTQEQEWTQEIENLQSGAEITVVSSLWGCSDEEDREPRTGDLGYEWHDTHCEDPNGVRNSVDASSGDSEEGVRVLTDDDEVPVLRAGYPDQRNATEVLNKGAADRINATTGELELGGNEAVFLIELTDGSPDWDEAQTQDSYGDPNYNDVIVLFEYNATVQEVAVGSWSDPENNDGFDPGNPGGGDSTSETGGEGSNIETDVTHVVIG